MKAHHATLLALAAATLFPVAALAEKADRDKPVNIESDKITVDDVKRQHIFEGNVTLTQGTLVIRSDRMVVTQDADGFQKGVAYGHPARFKQKREGKDEMVEGEGERIEHDAKSEVTEFFTRAWVKSGLDEVKGHYIQYDALTERYLVTAAPGTAKSASAPATPAGRVRAVIQPKRSGEQKAATGKDTVPLQSAKELAAPQQ